MAAEWTRYTARSEKTQSPGSPGTSGGLTPSSGSALQELVIQFEPEVGHDHFAGYHRAVSHLDSLDRLTAEKPLRPSHNTGNAFVAQFFLIVVRQLVSAENKRDVL